MQSLQSVVAGPIRWLTGAGSSADSDEGPYEPDVMDVLVVKAMLINGLHLPPEIVDCIIDQAEYWPHTTSSVEYGGQHGGTKVVTKFSNGSGGDLLLRTVPLGFLKWPTQRSSEPKQQDVYQAASPPRRSRQPFPPDAFQRLIGSPVPMVAHPCRKVVFTIRSRDQGWSSIVEDHSTYHGSWTWFEAGLERWCYEKSTDNTGENDDTENSHHIPTVTPSSPIPRQPSLKPEDLSSVYPGVRERVTGDCEFIHPLLPEEALKIQCNRVASREIIEHRVVWSYTDDGDPNNETQAAELSACGRGERTGDGSFVRGLQLGDVVTVWGQARFPGWVNNIESVRVDVYWFV